MPRVHPEGRTRACRARRAGSYTRLRSNACGGYRRGTTPSLAPARAAAHRARVPQIKEKLREKGAITEKMLDVLEQENTVKALEASRTAARGSCAAASAIPASSRTEAEVDLFSG